MKKLIWCLCLLCAWTASVPPSVRGDINAQALPVSGAAIAPGTQDNPVSGMHLSTGGTLDLVFSITLAYTGDSLSDLDAGSFALYTDADGDWGTAGDRGRIPATLNVTGTTIRFSDFIHNVSPETGTYLFVTCAAAESVTDGHTVNAEVTDRNDIVTFSGTCTGEFPLRSLDPAAPHRIAVTATRIEAYDWQGSVTAGQEVPFQVRCLDMYGNLDRDWANSSLAVEGADGVEPGTSAAGFVPAYRGGGPWTAAEGGTRSCSYTLYKTETGRHVRAADTSLGTRSSPSIAVSARSTAATAIAGIAGQTAGAPFIVQVYTTDDYGNRTSGHAGTVLTLSVESGLALSPGGYHPVLPAPATWSGDEPSGIMSLSVIAYNQCSDARLRVTDSGLGSSVSDVFPVACAPAVSYAISCPSETKLRTPVAIDVAAVDRWGNPADGYAGEALVACSDANAQLQASISFSGGRAGIEGMFYTGGEHTVVVTESGNAGMTGTASIMVDGPPQAVSFSVACPGTVRGGLPFETVICACDTAGAVIAEYSGTVDVSVDPPASVTPGRVMLMSGAWKGNLSVTGETLETVVSVSNGVITTRRAARLLVEVPGHERARAYPTVFAPRDGNVRIRYYLRSDGDVRVTVFNIVMDKICELFRPAGSDGGRRGLNVVEWNGRCEGDGAIGHSGGYHILIDKGYEQEWTGAVIKNY